MTFTPTLIDYENEQVWRQIGQASGNGEWFGFDDVNFMNIETFSDLSISDSISLPEISDDEVFEYCCLGYPDDWYEITDDMKSGEFLKHFEPMRIRVKNSYGDTRIVYEADFLKNN